MTTVQRVPFVGTAIVRRPRTVRAGWALVLVLLLLAIAAVSVAVGARDVAWQDILAAFGGAQETFSEAAVAKRIPRTLLAILVGGALGLSGAVMQAVTRNPLADPGILGVNTGAALAVSIGIAWFGMWSYTAYIWTAIIGAAVTAALVYTIGSLGRGGATPLKLALAGAAASIALSSFISAIVLGRNDIASVIRSWQIGGVGGGSFDAIGQVLPFLATGLLISLLTARSLNSLALGDDVAAGLGERVALVRATASLGAVILCGAATAVAGPIGFVGLVVPHVVRLLAGPDNRWLLPLSVCGGAVLLLAGDILGRLVVRPSELDVGIVTAFVGAPFFIWFVRRQKVREL